MNIWQAIVLGIVEGATEYLPISSTFHLIWTSKILALPVTDFLKTFEVVIQSGAIAAVVFLYSKTVLSDRKLIAKTLTSFVPTAAVGLILFKLIKGYFFENNLLQLFVFAAVGVFFIVYERWRRRKGTGRLAELTLAQAVVIGFAQALAVVPGVSRAGTVIVAMMILGYRRDEAAKYSFLLATPTIFAAGVLDLVETRAIIFDHGNGPMLLLVGFAAAFFSALIVIHWLIRFLEEHSLELFGWYRIGVFLLLALTLH